MPSFNFTVNETACSIFETDSSKELARRHFSNAFDAHAWGLLTCNQLMESQTNMLILAELTRMTSAQADVLMYIRKKAEESSSLIEEQKRTNELLSELLQLGYARLRQ